ncbi:hypothetical protein CQA49_07215 [Helicobacter sp. MIT 00-7814]|uniref:hypothetical protein n=1 Tax=unclassified Helicobacter TaxID=2593540 RepID=UPI000E1F0CE4|nr:MULTISPECIES: hypothetical protein [unclassified Helicobacter]RDU52699.1 hypothetical protein CQA37_08195 [Helicobacter sp. MIT 99-10781]RDU53133.1 hypothetical protein CQA49_07215 [Helicobacter sp. MIT 00-7814]
MTPAIIYLETQKNIFEAIVIDCDGYFEGLGANLLREFKTRDDVKELIGLGNIVSIRSNLRPKHDLEVIVQAFHAKYGENVTEWEPEAIHVLQSCFFRYETIFSYCLDMHNESQKISPIHNKNFYSHTNSVEDPNDFYEYYEYVFTLENKWLARENNTPWRSLEEILLPMSIGA